MAETDTAGWPAAFAAITGLDPDDFGTVEVLRCLACGCIFDPDDDGEAYWPDRYQYVRSEGEPCDTCTPCPCHALPREIPYQTETNR